MTSSACLMRRCRDRGSELTERPMAATTSLFGREPEIAAIDRLIDHAHARGGALVVSGPPGIGKSALLAAAAVRARGGGMTVLTTVGVPSEARLAFAGLHQLLQPVLGNIDELPRPQRDALAAAFGMIEGPAPNAFLTGLAVLELLAESAATMPVLVIADDAHWLDRSTADVLAFVARRLEHEPIALLAAVRDGFETPLDDARFPGLALDALDPDAAAALLDSTAATLSPAVRQRVIEEAAGNPLALTELPVAFEQLGERPHMPAWLPLTTRLEQAFAERLFDLPATTRSALLVAALNDGPSLSEVLAAGAQLVGSELTTEALAPAVLVRLAVLDDTQITFRHPLIRAAIASQASISQRHEAHAALAAVLVEHPDRCVWHRAASIIGPDETVATALETVADRAQRRGAVAVAAAGLERAAQLSGDSTRRVDRLLRAAELGFQIGRQDLVIRLVNEAEALELQPLDRARMRWLQGVFDGQQAGGADRFDAIIVTANALTAEGEVDLALNILWSAAIQCWWSDPGPRVSARIVHAAEAVRTDREEPIRLAILAFAAPLDQSAIVAEGLSHLTANADADADTARVIGTAANAIGAFALSASPLAVAAVGLRREGRIGLLARGLTQQAWGAAHRVELNIAIPVAEEAAQLTLETAQPTIHFTARAVQAMLAALRGDQTGAEHHATAAEEFGIARNAPALLSMVQHARGLAALADCRYVEAYENLRRMHTPGDPAFHSSMRALAVADLVDAAARSGQIEATRGIIAELEAIATTTSTPALHAGLRYARPLQANESDTEALFDAAETANTAWPFLRARALLARGEWLRQHRRVTESRAPLRAARETFDALGAIPWSGRARQQLRASGETSRRRTPETRDELTPQELQIVQLAAQGLTNREIGQMLYLSHRTISSHLYRTFPKLGITSRAQLRDALDEGHGGAGPPLP
jgi:DNA-binding CsgD family transcriptional regulator